MFTQNESKECNPSVAPSYSHWHTSLRRTKKSAEPPNSTSPRPIGTRRSHGTIGRPNATGRLLNVMTNCKHTARRRNTSKPLRDPTPSSAVWYHHSASIPETILDIFRHGARSKPHGLTT